MTGKILRSFLLTALIALLASSILFGIVVLSAESEKAADRLEKQASQLASVLEAQGDVYLMTLPDAEERFTLTDASGRVQWDSGLEAKGADLSGQTEIRQAMETGSGRSGSAFGFSAQGWLSYALRLSDGRVLRMGCPQEPLREVLGMLLTPFPAIAALVFIISGVLSFRLARRITDPILSIGNDAPSAETYPELQPLADRLAEQECIIRDQKLELSRRQQEFSAITENMREGFLLLDGSERILSGNHSARQLLGIPERTDELCSLRSLDCWSSLSDAVETALSGSHAELVMQRDGRSWQTVASCVRTGSGIAGAVLIFMDVTERAQREALRREFSANVSHELKTPLTSISGFAELMKEGLVPPEKIPEFSGDIYRESRRLIDLIDDIVQLSRLDENSALPEKTAVDLEPICQQVLQTLRPAAEKQSVSLQFSGSSTVVPGVSQLLRELVFNLVDNAIKYNVPGGCVFVYLEKRGTAPVLRVTDTGIGIPYAHQSRIFERFYRVDKSHSKEVGGTGLGLSIVKHAAQEHGAALELDSFPGKGTTIRVVFPAK